MSKYYTTARSPPSMSSASITVEITELEKKNVDRALELIEIRNKLKATTERDEKEKLREERDDLKESITTTKKTIKEMKRKRVLAIAEEKRRPKKSMTSEEKKSSWRRRYCQANATRIRETMHNKFELMTQTDLLLVSKDLKDTIKRRFPKEKSEKELLRKAQWKMFKETIDNLEDDVH